MINWVCKIFNELTAWELYEILQLRSEVFVVEQNCAYMDPDGKDPLSYHFMGWEDGKLVAYTRLIPAGVTYKEISIGRVVNSPSVRGRGIGKLLMEESVKKIHEFFGKQDIMIGAQLYLNKFYTSLGFINEGEIYLEDGIEHIHMRLKKEDI
jgi:ElaA protein